MEYEKKYSQNVHTTVILVMPIYLVNAILRAYLNLSCLLLDVDTQSIPSVFCSTLKCKATIIYS